MFGQDIDVCNDCKTCALSGLCGDLCERYQAYRRTIKLELEGMPEHFSVELHCKIYRGKDPKSRIMFKELYLRRINDQEE